MELTKTKLLMSKTTDDYHLNLPQTSNPDKAATMKQAS
jgi:hypothetical protein